MTLVGKNSLNKYGLKEEYAGHIREQWAKLGLSLDYSRERFYVRWWIIRSGSQSFRDAIWKGLIYRGEYIINWDPQARTALSDIEVIHKDIEGAFYHMSYELADGSGVVEIATTRPETMLGIQQSRFIQKMNVIAMIGKKWSCLWSIEIPIIADEYVDQEFGTGVVKSLLPMTRMTLRSVTAMTHHGSMSWMMTEQWTT